MLKHGNKSPSSLVDGDEDSDWGFSDSDDDWYESETEMESQTEAEMANPSKRSKYLFHTTYNWNIMCQKCEGNCGLWVLN